jgi:hypothetical protein
MGVAIFTATKYQWVAKGAATPLTYPIMYSIA